MFNIYLKKTTILIFYFFFLTTTLHAQEPELGLTTIITGLDKPIQVINAGDGSNRLFVVLQGSSNTGYIIVYRREVNLTYTKIDTFLTVNNIRTVGQEEGLLSAVFHPDYENIASPGYGFFYVYYTNSAGNLQIARYKVSDSNPDSAAQSSKDTLITIPHPSNDNHNGGTLNFGPDGYLYISTGDGGGGGDTPNNAQRADVLLGKMLRFNVNSADSIPLDNPYRGVTSPDTLDAIFAFGLRNPFRWSFDRQTGDMWIGDVGQGLWEEIDFRRADSTAKSNYGWRCYEGNATYNTSACSLPGKFIFPVFVYPNAGSAVTGGVVYRGTVPTNAPLVGYYLATDYYTGNFFKIRRNGDVWTVYTQNVVKRYVPHFGEDEDGEILVVSQFDNDISRVIVTDVLPARLIEFTAQKLNDKVQLKWTTTFEENLGKFEIEYSTDGLNYHHAGNVNALNLASGAAYTFSHDPASRGRIFYRLRMVDIDGQFDYSDIASVMVERPDKYFVQPSVISTGTMNVYLTTSYNTLELINMNGAVLLSYNISGRTGRIDIPVPHVSTGSYIVQLKNNETTLRQRILIQK